MTHNGQRVWAGSVTSAARPVTGPGSLAGICPGGQDGMAQFLQIPAKDEIVSVARICPEPQSRCR